MKSYRWIIAGIILCLVVAGGSYLWASGMMDSLYAFRSPLHSDPPAPAPALGQPVVRRVVFVLIDALRLDTSLNPQVMPVLNRLRQESAYARTHSRPPSYSEPGYTVLLTGAWPELSDGPAMNLDYADIPTWTQDNLFSAAHRAGLRTAVSGFNWFQKLIPQDAVDDSFYTPGEDRYADIQVVDAALPWLQADKDQFTLIHIDQVDYAGHHEGGPQSPNWNAAASRADALLGEILGKLDLSQDVIFVASDHGQIDRGGHGGNEPIVLLEPFVLAGAHVKPGNYGDVNMVDVAPTLAVLLGTNLPATAQGQARTAMLDLTPTQQQAVQDAETVQQARLLQTYDSVVAPTQAIPAGNLSVAQTQAAIAAARDSRLSRERLPRFVLALILALLLLALLIWKRSRYTLIWLASGLAFVVLFNIVYAFIERLTYSLSWVTGATGLVITVAAIVLTALTPVWLAVMLAKRIFRNGPRAAAGFTLGFVAMTFYLLALPVLWSLAWNGPLVGWALPEFTSWYLALLSLVQGLVVAVAGLVFAGVAALVARLATQRKSEEEPSYGLSSNR
jgi:hypothetical protein